MTVSKSYLAIHLEGLSNIILSKKLELCFQEQKPFCFENGVSHTWLRHV